MATFLICAAVLIVVLLVAFVYEIFFTYRDGGLWR